MRLGWVNRADSASLSVDRELASLPGSNTQNAHLASRWDPGGLYTTTAIYWDLGAAQACDTLALLGTTLDVDSWVIICAANSSPAGSWGEFGFESADYYLSTNPSGLVDGYGACYVQFPSLARRYWAVAVRNGDASAWQLGRVFLGPTWEPSVDMQLPWQISSVDPSEISRSHGGQVYAEERPQQRVLQFALGFMSETEMFSNAFALTRAQGIVGDVLAIPDPDSDYIVQQSVWGRLAQAEPMVNDRLNLYRTRYTIEERL